eukprot:scaffold117185_cov67-Phaeocystis_antarctica.AAC.4
MQCAVARRRFMRGRRAWGCPRRASANYSACQSIRRSGVLGVRGRYAPARVAVARRKAVGPKP